MSCFNKKGEMMKEFNGINILEVWDYRLSSATPIILNSGENWVIEIHSKSGEINEPLERHDTGIKTEPGDIHSVTKIKKCYEWLYSIRDKYALENIEELKPLAARANAANAVYAKTLKVGGQS